MYIQTEIEVENTLTEECAWVPCTIKIDSISYVRPSINDDNKYDGTSVCLKDGTTIYIKMSYEEIRNKLLFPYPCP